jgi:hemerythrin
MARIKPIRQLSPLVWLSVFETGEEVPDRQHRKLMADINNLTELLFEGRRWSSIVVKSKELHEDSLEHFRAEEEMLKRIGYALLPQHRTIHRELARQLDNIAGHLARITQASQADIESALYLRSMLVDHFFRQDFAYKAHVLEARESRGGNQRRIIH